MDYKAKARELLAPWEQFHPRTFEEMVAKVAEALQSQSQPTGGASTGLEQQIGPQNVDYSKLTPTTFPVVASTGEGEPRRHDWEFLADTTAKCRSCGLHVPSASAPFHLHNCVPKPESPLLEPMMTCDEPVAAPVSDGPRSEGIWVIMYAPTEHDPEIFMGAGAEEAARKRYAIAKLNWTCHLLCEAGGVSDGRLEGAEQWLEKVMGIPNQRIPYTMSMISDLLEAYAESVASSLRAQLEQAQEAAHEFNMLAYGWMVRHDAFNSFIGKFPEVARKLWEDKSLPPCPSPTDIPEAIKRAEQAESSLREARLELEQLRKEKGEVKDGDIQGQQAKDPEADAKEDQG